MAEEVRSIDVSEVPDLLRLAEEVHRTNQPRLLKCQDEELAVIMPVKPSRRRGRRTGIITRDDPFFRMIGTGDSGIPGGISGRKYDYFKEAFGAKE